MPSTPATALFLAATIRNSALDHRVTLPRQELRCPSHNIKRTGACLLRPTHPRHLAGSKTASVCGSGRLPLDPVAEQASVWVAGRPTIPWGLRSEGASSASERKMRGLYGSVRRLSSLVGTNVRPSSLITRSTPRLTQRSKHSGVIERKSAANRRDTQPTGNCPSSMVCACRRRSTLVGVTFALYLVTVGSWQLRCERCPSCLALRVHRAASFFR
jgi:hypothetical protein